MNLISEAIWLFFATTFIYCLGRREHARVSKTSDRKRVHGQFIPEWVAIGFATPAVFMLYHGIGVFTASPGAMGMCLFGLLGGLAIGWVHGSFRLLWHADADTINTGATHALPSDDGNPYRPPNGG